MERIKLELKFREKDFFKNRGYDSLDIVFGGDHGNRRFQSVIRLIFRNSTNCEVEPYYVTQTVGSIECAKDSREILENTIAGLLNEGLQRIMNYIICTDDYIMFSDDRTENCNWDFRLKKLICGDLAFFATILGKENMSSTWCTWCMLSKMQCSAGGHELGDLWDIQKTKDIREGVERKEISQRPENLKGCTHMPLFDAVPIQNFILSILHIIIGVGNKFMFSFLEWVEERVEQLSEPEILRRNSIICAEVQKKIADEENDNGLLNEGAELVDKQLESQQLTFLLNGRVSKNTLISVVQSCPA